MRKRRREGEGRRREMKKTEKREGKEKRDGAEGGGVTRTSQCHTKGHRGPTPLGPSAGGEGPWKESRLGRRPATEWEGHKREGEGRPLH